MMQRCGNTEGVVWCIKRDEWYFLRIKEMDYELHNS
jgi:PHD/YefM family antitoxin component YafN of YafNO toxin-antitoxin module